MTIQKFEMMFLFACGWYGWAGQVARGGACGGEGAGWADGWACVRVRGKQDGERNEDHCEYAKRGEEEK